MRSTGARTCCSPPTARVELGPGAPDRGLRRERRRDGAGPSRWAARRSVVGAGQLPPHRRRGRLHPRRFADRDPVRRARDRRPRRRGGPRRRRRRGHRLAMLGHRRCDRLGHVARRWRNRRPTRRDQATPEPAVHVGHDRPAEGHRTAAHDVRRRRHDGRASRGPRHRRLRRCSAPTWWSARCTTPVRCRGCVCSAPASRR